MSPRARAAAAGAVALIVTLLVFVPIAPSEVESEPDLSFRSTTHDAFARGLQHGSEIISIYGPWGVLQHGYDRRTDATVLIASTLLAFAFAWGVARIAGDAGAAPEVTAVLAVAAAALVAMAGGDSAFTAIALLLLLSLLAAPSLVRELPLAAALGLVANIKFSLLVFALFAIGAATLVRRRAEHAVAFTIAFFIAWFAAGQHIGGLFRYVARSAELASGYAEASAIGSGVPVAVAGVVGLVLLAALFERSVLRTAIVAGAALFLARVGYVRFDPPHAKIADALLLLFCGGYLLLRRDRVPALRRVIVATGALATIFALAVAGPVLVWKCTRQLMWLHQRASRLAAMEREIASRSGSANVPRNAGTIDAYPWGSAALIAAGMPLDSRPVPGSAMVWTPALAERNADFLRGPRAPQWLWTSVSAIDGRLPLLHDAPSWPEMMRRYEIANVRGDWMLLRRSTSPRSLKFAPLTATNVPFGGTVVLPEAPLLWCAIEMQRTLMTRLRRAFARPPPVTLETTTMDGGVRRWQVSAELLRGGFLLSPEVATAADLERLIASDRGRAVKQLRLIADGYGETYTLRFSALLLSGR